MSIKSLFEQKMFKNTVKNRNFIAKDLRTPKYSLKRQKTAKDFVRSIEKNRARKESSEIYVY
jgi:hypothetical protein